MLVGLLGNHLWSVSGTPHGRERISATLLEPFASYTLPSKTSFIFTSESTYDWTTKRGTIPLNVTVTQLVKIGDQLFQFQAGPRYFARRDGTYGRWGARFSVSLVYPLN